ncbi:hypothetical protein D3C71_2047160 [compost metagenome]
MAQPALKPLDVPVQQGPSKFVIVDMELRCMVERVNAQGLAKSNIFRCAPVITGKIMDLPQQRELL